MNQPKPTKPGTGDLNSDQQKVLNQVKASRILLPVIIGLGVVGYLVWKKFDPVAFAKIEWNQHTATWIIAGMLFLVLRHLFYSARLYIITQGVFSYFKCIELIFIFEFSTTIAPTQVGGAAVAIVVLSQEKLSAARTATVVLLKVVLDSLFFLITLPLFAIVIGPRMIRPGLDSFANLDSWGIAFIVSYIGMAIYSGLFIYGLLINPKGARKLLNWIVSPGFMKKFRERAVKLGDEFVLSSNEIQQQPRIFFLKAIGATTFAWLSKFCMMSCLIIAFVPDISRDFLTQLTIYARLEAMFVITAFSPTPGGSGLAEAAFEGFFKDFITGAGTALIVAFVWRLMAYYTYLVLGLFIIPNWLRKIVAKKAT